MEEPDISLELGLDAGEPDDGFTSAFGLVPATLPARDAEGVVFAGLAVPFAVPVPAAVFAVLRAAEFTLFFVAVLADLAIVLTAVAVFFGAGLSGSLTVFASLLATVFRIAFFAGALAVLLFDGAGAFAAALLTLLAAALLVADLVTVAFMMCLHD